eukprot:3780760-Rhodomonas_salina.2
MAGVVQVGRAGLAVARRDRDSGSSRRGAALPRSKHFSHLYGTGGERQLISRVCTVCSASSDGCGAESGGRPCLVLRKAGCAAQYRGSGTNEGAGVQGRVGRRRCGGMCSRYRYPPTICSYALPMPCPVPPTICSYTDPMPCPVPLYRRLLCSPY